jgi:hypothetical protein
MKSQTKELALTKIDGCSACGSKKLTTLIELPKFPHIGVYLKSRNEEDDYPPVDNSLHFCEDCTHIQLGMAVDPSFLYQPSFQHKTSQSALAIQANNFLYDYIKKITGDNEIRLVAEIGCNDTFLLQKFVENDKANVVGVDPILRDMESKFLENVPEKYRDKYSIIGDFIENADFKGSHGKYPDIFVTNFVFEHLKRPAEVVSSILSQMADDSYAFIGVPTAEYMVKNARFDQLSHQHYQQFNIHSLHKMISIRGGEVVDYKVNFTNWGQTIIAFKKLKGGGEASLPTSTITKELAVQSLSQFKSELTGVLNKIDLLKGKPIFGFGAAQNFPILSYFFNKELPFEVILDDHPMRQNMHYPHLPYKILEPDQSYEGCIGMLTGPDYARVLMARMAQLKFDHIVTPFSSY